MVFGYTFLASYVSNVISDGGPTLEAFEIGFEEFEDDDGVPDSVS